MRVFGSFITFLMLAGSALGATFGTVVNVLGGASDIVLDEPRNKLYLPNSQASRVEVYLTNFSPPRASNALLGCKTPVSAAMSPDRKRLYVTCYDDSALAVYDLDNPGTNFGKISLPAKPEGVAVGGDGRVLITTIGTGQGRQSLLIYDPTGATGVNLTDVFVAPPLPASPTLPPPNGRIFQAYKSHLETTRDGQYIIGVNGSGNTRYIFVYEVVSGTVLRSRSVTNISGVLSIAPDGKSFMAGSTLFDTATLQVLAQENAANAPFPFPTGNSGNFNLQQNQGGSVYSPDGTRIYAAFNMAPVQNPPARANTTRLLINDPDNLLIQIGLQLPENLAGKMVITRDGSRIYALSESGFVVLPIATMNQFPLAVPQSRVALLANDQCGVTASQQDSTISVRNIGGGNRMTVSAQLLQLPGNTAGLGGFGGPGGGGTSGTIVIVLPPTVTGGGAVPGRGGFTAPTTNTGGNQTSVAQTSPFIRMSQGPDGSPQIDFLYNSVNARSLGTVAPHDFLIQSPEAINIPADIRIYQNNRDADSRGTIVPVQIGVSNSEGLIDMLADNGRQRLYIANSGLNRVEVFDMKTQTFLSPIKVGQLPRSLAFGVDSSTLYVASNGGESISIVDLDQMKMTGRVKFPPLPFNAGFSLITPAVIASSQRGPQILMSDGTLWKIVGDTAQPRILNPSVFGTNVRVVPAANPAVRTMASTPEGNYIMLMTSSGYVYLYDASVDDFIMGRQIFNTPLTGFIGPVAAGPGGQYYLANNTILNSSLTPIAAAPTVTIGGQTGPTTGTGGGGGRPGTPGPAPTPTPVPEPDPTQPPVPGQIPGVGGSLPTRGAPITASRPVSAVAAVGKNQFMRFSQAIRINNTTAPTDAGVVELVDATTGNTLTYTNALEGPLSTVQGTNGRATINGRTMAVDPSGNFAYVLTTSGLSIVPMSRISASDRPRISPQGIVNTASYMASTAPGGLIAIFGQNLADPDQATTSPLPTTLGGACVTLSNSPLPLMMTSPGQINAQVPPNAPAGRYNIVVRSIDHHMPSGTTQLTVSKYAPAVFVDSTGQAAIYHSDGRPVNKNNRAHRDERLVLYATGLGATKGGRVNPGAPAPSNPLAVTDKVQVFFGNPGYKQAEIIVEWSGLVPGLVGVNQINLYVPGDHMKGDALPVTLRIGGVNSPSTGPAVPYVAVE